jgi:hypothetical protein
MNEAGTWDLLPMLFARLRHACVARHHGGAIGVPVTESISPGFPEGLRALPHAMRALSYDMGALPVRHWSHPRTFPRNRTARGSSSVTSQFVRLNSAFSRSALELTCSPARAAVGEDQLPGRGSTLTRWRPEQRPPTVQVNAQSIARESEDAS